MQWLNKLIDEIIAHQPDGEVIVESGIAPSGSYHMGYLREIVTCDAIVRALRKRGRQARHVHFVDDLDGFRKVPANMPARYEKYLGMPLCDIPAPDGSDRSYADYAVKSFLDSVAALGIEMEVLYSHKQYRSGWFVPAIEKSLEHVAELRKVLEDVSGRKLDDSYSPIQVNEGGYLKKRAFVAIDTSSKEITYRGIDDSEHRVNYANGNVKLDWRVDWPARWWLLGVTAEPFGRDHGTKGGSYDTGAAMMESVFEAPPPVPVPYHFINRAGDTKKMSASKGNGILMEEVVRVLPPEVVRFFILRAAPARQLFFDPEGGVVRLIDEFAELLAKPDKDDAEQQLVELCTEGLAHATVSNVPFSHLVASYQAALKNPEITLEVIRRTEYKETVAAEKDVLVRELQFIDEWLKRWAPDDVKFDLLKTFDPGTLTEQEQAFLKALGEKIVSAPADADGTWFHQAIYDFKETSGLSPKELFTTLYRALIGKTSGPRAGWFLSILPREWLVKRLKLEG
jgi:lysyl-tRNA synthetase class 1